MTTPTATTKRWPANTCWACSKAPPRLEAERRLASDAAFAREVEGWRTRFAAFDDATEPQPAGDELWRKIEAGVPAAASREARRAIRLDPVLEQSRRAARHSARRVARGAAARRGPGLRDPRRVTSSR